jgi:chromate transporter
MSANKTERRSEPGSVAPSSGEAARVWAKIGLLSFGGPAGQIALMHRMLVEERRWIGEDRFLHALNFCMLLPGPEAIQLATYIGWLLHGWRGGIAAGVLFLLPGVIVVGALSGFYAFYGNVPLVEAAFLGIKAAVLVIVVEALLRVAGRALHRPAHWLVAAAALIGIFFFAIPFPIIVGAAALAGYGLSRMEGPLASSRISDAPPVPLGQTLGVATLWLAIWLLPLLAISYAFAGEPVLTDIGLFFSKLAVVTFGGAYAVLAYMAQQAVENYGWLSPGEMLDGLGLAETTPGPLILVTEFVGFLAGLRQGGEPALLFGLLGAGIAVWATFVPSFLFIFVGAPYIERLRANPALAGALRGVTAAVVGVIFNLAVWFALHVFFARVDAVSIGPLRIWRPELASLNLEALILFALASLALLLLRFGIVSTLALTAGASLAWYLLQSA